MIMWIPIDVYRDWADRGMTSTLHQEFNQMVRAYTDCRVDYDKYTCLTLDGVIKVRRTTRFETSIAIHFDDVPSRIV